MWTAPMAELQYGSGLRISELLELRVRGGKGDKDRAIVLSHKLIPRLQAQLPAGTLR